MNTIYENLEDVGMKVIASMTTPSKPGKKPRPVFVVSGRTSGYEEIFRDLGGKKFRGQWSFWEDPTDSLLDAINKYGKLSFADQIEAKTERMLNRAERYEGYMENAQARAESRSKAADAISSFIPMGQPILVGHHSERRHRRDLDRIGSNIRKSIEESKKADYFSNRIANLERDARRSTESRSYIMNRLEEQESYLRKLTRNPTWYADSDVRVAVTQEKIDFWKSRLALAEDSLNESGKRVASPETIRNGFFVKYTGTWYEVVRVSKKSVTISNWLDVPTFTYRLRYADLSDFREPPKKDVMEISNQDPQNITLP